MLIAELDSALKAIATRVQRPGIQERAVAA